MEIYHRTILADLLTPVSAFLRIAGGADRAFLLESVEGGEKIGRYSFIGVHPDRSFAGSFSDFRRNFPRAVPSPEGLPPFIGGAVGVFSYDMVRELEKIPDLREAGPDEPPSVMMDFYSTVLAFDHLKHQIIIVSREGMEKIEQCERLLREPLPGNREKGLLHVPVEPLWTEGVEHEASPNFTREAFCEAVRRAKDYIRLGDIFQVVLSQRFHVPYHGDPFNVYRALRFINPSPYLFFLKLGETAIAGSSPEMLLKVEGSTLHYRPIAGTRRRGHTAEEDEFLERELLSDAKERAEHLMLVDLGRNDLGRVSEYGSVRVQGLMFLEKYSHVVHMVSSLRGRLRSDLNCFDALSACFPAGTVTGAPKVRAMEIIEELEPCRRGIYAGAIGYLDFSGNLDSCIAIRTVVLSPGCACLQAGAGIVADSVPELEYKECHNKAKVLFQALKLASQIED